MNNVRLLGVMVFLLAAATALLALFQACATSGPTKDDNAGPPGTPAPSAEPRPALDSVNAEDLLRHIKVLSSDEYEGRGPATRGEELSAGYITEQFRRLGLKPGNPDGTYVQKVPLAGIRSRPQASFVAGGRTFNPKFPDDYVAVSRRLVPQVDVENSELVFVGYGVEAPEYGWDDYKGVDVRGKTVVMLINDPAVPDPADPSRLDEKLFKGRAMTYYGRWTYKYEQASRKGAAAAVIIHEEGPAGYPWKVVASSWGRENFDLQAPDKNAGRVAVESWIGYGQAKELFAAAAQDLDALKKSALGRDFRPVPLGARASFTVRNALRTVDSQNVLAKLEGSDPTLKNEYVVYTAHWDHLGRDEARQGDQIYNGAVDNASGVAAVLEIAEAFTRLRTPPRRSVLFLAVTAEEKGLLGAKYYAEHPLYPLERTLADINIDGLNQWGRTRDVVVVGQGNTTLEDLLQEEAAGQGRTTRPDPEPEKGFFYRSDQFEFARQGVPALYTDTGTEYLGRPPEYGRQKRDEYTSRDYHEVTDEVKPDWDLSGAVEDVRLLFLVGQRVAGADRYPEWKPGAEFKARRDEMLRRAGGAR